MNATIAKVITWQTDSGDKINICRECESRLRAEGEWPRNQRGEEYCQVSMGLHRGHCDTCEE
jgi:hypothetical protein